MNPFERATIRVEINPPYHAHAQKRTVELAFAPTEWMQMFAPLPRDHDAGIMFGPLAEAQAERQRRTRREWVNRFSDRIAHMLLHAIEAQDPHFGYSPDEWAKIQEYTDKPR